jgi:hypothetical protein
MLRHHIGPERERGLEHQPFTPLRFATILVEPGAEPFTDAVHDIEQLQPEGFGDGSEDLRRRLLAAALDLGEVLR